ncbi:MAG: UvrD-helicase domain-containing protein [Bacteroidales bacterium]|nr:UvrD-helicase domain-containing protein [Bacteroidales bacterium]
MPTQDNRNKSFFVYKASAGSGKTFQLAVAYIRICLQYFGQDRFIFRKILAITFTNKAVGEMKSRILFFLRCLSLPEERLNAKELEQRALLIQELSAVCPLEQMGHRSEIILKNILADYSRFSVLTIDKFYQQLVHAFAFELHLPANHRLELDEDLFSRQMVDVLLSKLGYDDMLTDFVVEYMHHRIDGQQWWKPDRDLAAVAKELFNEEALSYESEMPRFPLENYRNLIRTLKTGIRQMEGTLRKIGGQALSIIPETVSVESDFYHGKSGFGAWLMSVADGDMEKAAAPNSYVRQAVDEGRWTAKNCRTELSASIERIVPQLEVAYRDVASFVNAHYSDYILYGHILKNIYPTALLGEFRKVAEEIMASSHQILIGETNRMIAKVVDAEEVPFIYERLGERYGFFFIDEFQDTSRLQWRNLLPLVSEGVSKVMEETGGSGQTSLFGDAKQAIYRFRSGDVRQFVHLSRLDKEPAVNLSEKVLQSGFQTIPLNNNFRSKKEIVQFNNSYFHQMTEKSTPLVSDAYHSLEQSLPKKTGGGVELRVTAETKDYELFVQMQTAGLVEEVLRDGYAYHEIAVLTRSNKLASSVAVALTRKGVPVVSSESLLLSASPEVRFMIAAMQYVENRKNEAARAHLLVYLFQKLEKGKSLDDVLGLAKNASAFSTQLERWGFCPDWKRLRQLNLYERFRTLADIFRLWGSDPYMMALGEVVWAYHENAEKNDEDFLEEWEEQRQRLSLSNPEGVNAVQVMTIHKAKGLAFPVVIYPMARKKNRLEKEQGWIRLDPPVQAGADSLKVAWLDLDKSLDKTRYSDVYQAEEEMSELDRINLDYVAFTRAKDRLYLLARQEKQERDGLIPFFHSCGIEPDAMGDAYGTMRYHFPKGERFASSVSDCLEPADVTGFFSFPDIGPFPPLAYTVPEEGASTEAALGTLVHQYLSRMYRREDVDILCKTVNKSEALKPDERAFLLKLLANIREQPEADCLFGDEGTFVRNEVEMLLPDKKILRLDRLLIKGKDVRLIDYKTGQRDNSHESQLKGYIDGLRQIGYNVTDARLVYIAPETAHIRSLPISLR